MKLNINHALVIILIVIGMTLSACGAAQNQIPDLAPSPVLAISTSPSTTVAANSTNILNSSSTPPAISKPTEINMEFVQDGCPTFGMHPAKLSPDGLWLASECFDGEHAHVRIARFDRTKVWDLNFQDITGVSPCVSHSTSYGETVCFYGILYIDHWFKTGRYVFVSADYLIDRGFTFSFGLYRIDTETGRVSAYLPLGEYTYNYAFDSNDEYYAYVTGSDNYLLHIVSLETGKDSTYTAPGSYSSLGELVWSPDNKKLAFEAQGIGWTEDPKIGFSLDIFDVETEKFTTLISNDMRRFRPVKWLFGDGLLLFGFSDDGQSYLQYQLDVSSNQLVVIPDVTPTP